MLGVAAAINPVRLATAVDVLHERTIVAHYHDDGVVGDAKPVDFVQDFAEAEIVKQDVDDVGWPATVPFADFGQFGLYLGVFLGSPLTVLRRKSLVLGIVDDVT